MLTEKNKIFVASILIFSLHVLGGIVLFAGGLSSQDLLLTSGLAVTAYLLGLRHAFDADHIAAIDNTVRRLSSEKKDSSLVGFFFSLGHSTVVLLAGVAVVFGFTAIGELLGDDSSILRTTGAAVGGTVAGFFLILIAFINIGILRKTIKSSEGKEVAPKGIITTILSPILKNVDRDWKMYPLGLLFGLGLDTATSITLLAISGGAALASGNTWIALALPIIFMAGMSLGDTLDSVLMSKAYSYSADPKSRKKYFIVITSVSVSAALLVGLPLLVNNLLNISGFSAELPELNFEYLGFIIVITLLSIWIIFGVKSKINKNNLSFAKKGY